MTDRQSSTFEKKSNSSPEASILVDKYRFNNFFREYINRDYIYLKDVSLEEFKIFCYKHNKFMLKRNWLCEGAGIRKCFLNNDNEIENFYKINQGYALVEEIIEQHKKMSELHPQSVNTIRVTTWFYKDNPHIVSSALRIGTGNNCTDNLHNAGLGCAVDIESGIVISKGYDKNSNSFLKHPDTGVTILGFKIPNWDIVCNTVLEAAKLISSVKWIGWDIAITEKGCTIIEGNTIQAVDLIQVGQDGLWPKIKAISKE